MNKYWSFVLLIFLFSCQEQVKKSPLFQLLNNEEIGIDFINQLEYDREFNVYKYRNYYNGGGVALGDVNNDGLIDIYFTGNLKKNKLYLNQGDNTFKDISASAGVEGTRSWSTGVTMVDINADGFLDIYVCNSGDIEGGNKENEFFINNGDLTFTESAADFGLNDQGFSTHTSFFDYDKDGDLDVYLLNNSYQAIGSFNLKISERPVRDVNGGDKLLRNDNGVFVDVSEAAGIYGSVIGFGLGVTIGDVNNDMWEDIYVSNDFFERDYLYINNKDNTFKEVLTDQMGTISGASMGADMADINNDGNADIFITEMLPSDPERLKSVTTFEDWNKYQYNVSNGYHHQFTRNTLQYNNGDDTFSELGRFAGVEASDWSWGALFFDMDNDGLKDLFIANGIYQDLTDQDYLQYVANEQVIKSIVEGDGVNYKELIDIIPSNPIPNHFYKNNGGLSFERLNQVELNQPSFSNGAAYGDLDNDGDLDLVINNVNMPPFIYENKANENTAPQNYLTIQLEGEGKNMDAIGARIYISTSDGEVKNFHVQPARGFQSSIDSRVLCGLGSSGIADIKVIWPDMSTTVLEGQTANQIITIKKDGRASAEKEIDSKIINIVFKEENRLMHIHQENNYNDFNRERLIYHMKSNLNPHMGFGDIDKNGLEDVVVTGSKDGQTVVYFQNENGFTKEAELGDLITKEKEHSDVFVFDANGDGALDIYLASGGVDISPFSPNLFDDLWMNDGSGQFTLSDQKLPNAKDNISSSVVTGSDFDKDGDIDLFVGERVKIGKYGAPCNGYILQNDGKGAFSDVTAELAPELQGINMINDAQFADIDGDGSDELILVGEFMPVKIYKWNGDQWKAIKTNLNSSGWYNALHISDLNNDGLKDVIVGNHGLNSRFEASEDAPLKLYFSDFDKNGFPDGVLTYTLEDGKDYPYSLRHVLLEQLKFLKRRIPDYKSYKNLSLDQIFTKEELAEAAVLEANDFNTKVYINQRNGNFESIALPIEAQFTPIFAISSGDYDHDGDIDIIMGGNQYNVLPEAGIYDASYGVYLSNNGAGGFDYVSPSDSGLKLLGQARDMHTSSNSVYVAMNNDSLRTFKY